MHTIDSFEDAGSFSLSSKHAVASYDIDDAFSDTEDPISSFHLNPEAIRADLSKAITSTSWAGLESDDDGLNSHHNGLFDAQDTSVSSLDINGSPHSASTSSEYLPSRSRPESPVEEHFSQISLSNSEANSIAHAEYPSEQEAPSEPQNDSGLNGTSDNPHPQIAASNPNSAQNTPLSSPPSDAQRFTPSPPHTSPPTTPMPYITPPASFAASASSSVPSLASPSLHRHSPRSSDVGAEHSPRSITSNAVPPSPSKPEHHPTVRPTRSAGPSIFEKVRSKTRPTFLPPKSRKEDDKHLADWQAMMRQSRIAAEKRRKALQDRRLAREKKIDESIHIWEKEILPDWRVVHKNPHLRKLWWNGIPTKLRAHMWEKAVGNPLALSKDNYRACLARAKRALSSGTFPSETLSLIEADIATTLPALHIFHSEMGPLYQDLKDMLCAWVVSRSDEGLGYTTGVSRVAAMFLISMPPQQGFVVMRNLLERHCMRSFYGGAATKDDVEAYYRIFDTLLADGMPKIYFNFKQHQISPSAYLPDWLIPLFLDHLPFEACARIWDVILLEGDAFLYRAALAILAVLESRLFFPDRKELLELLKGENKAALDVAQREGQPLNGGKYEIYGVDEETLWERIQSMEDWWKESTWTRLIQRELPDL
ncbi:hypothetical protein PC9H_003329 [Pleurotus ostreatus]|uniref:Rab-GAP TBC domain-containing protein n=2 Tax=Pleurotus TaxID=5320 RepID=A0A8H7A266_PLEOS|nr:uncharacterized protein PC9H_003329 [Pleurotus ostreatus]KAF7436496.1 hypothetical protein PC9H_003329 [Pleurotus ostreatus]KAG9222500.1 hypothetical protein CCMSSC00406_0002835 [Pleurotus cornucopiae]